MDVIKTLFKGGPDPYFCFWKVRKIRWSNVGLKLSLEVPGQSKPAELKLES